MRLQLLGRGLHSNGHLPWHTSLSLLLFSVCIGWSSLKGRKNSTLRARMEQCFTLATSNFSQRVRFGNDSVAALSATCEIVRASITQISLIQCSRKFSDLSRKIRRVCETLHLRNDRRSNDHRIGVTMHAPHLIDVRDTKADGDRKRREPPHTRHEFLCFGAHSLARASDTGA